MRNIQAVRILGCAVILASVAGCSLSNSHSARVQVSMPRGGFASRVQASPSPAPSGYVPVAGYAGATGSGGEDFPVPTQLSDFKCAAVIVTAPDINADPAFTEACGPVDAVGAPMNVGVFGGFVSTTGGTIDLKVQNGGGRRFQLIGVQYDGAVCPSAQEILSHSRNEGESMRLGNPYLLASVTQDIAGDQSIYMTASFTPGATPHFRCNSGRDGGVSLSSLDMYPHYPTAGRTFRVEGIVKSHGQGMIDLGLYSDASCSATVPTTLNWVGSSSRFVLSAFNLPQSPALYYVRATSGSGSSECTPIPGPSGQGFAYDASAKAVEIQPTPVYSSGPKPIGPGVVVDEGTATNSLNISVNCTGNSSLHVYMYLNGTFARDCGICYNYGSCYAESGIWSGIPDGPVALTLRLVDPTDPALTPLADDGYTLVRDSLTPAMSVYSVPNGGFVAGGSVVIQGSCGAEGQPVDVFASPLNSSGDGMPLTTTTCSGGAWSATVGLAGLPDGTHMLKFRHWGLLPDARGKYHYAYGSTSINKVSSILEQYVNGYNDTQINGLVGDGAGTFWGAGTDNKYSNGNWIVRSNPGGAWAEVDYVAGTYGAKATGIARGPNGYLYVTGFAVETGNQWMVRRSPSGAAGSWSTVDTFQLAAGYNASPSAIAVSSLGAIYVAGQVMDSSNYAHWIVRKSVDNGTTWTTSDDYFSPGSDRAPSAIAFGTGGFVYVGGFEYVSGNQMWAMRVYDPGVPGWSSTYFDPAQSTGSNQSIKGLAVAYNGLVYAVGNGNGLSSNSVWVVATYDGTNWNVLDRYLPPTQYTQYSQARTAAIDPISGALYVGGQVTAYSSEHYGYVVRRYLAGTWTNAGVDTYSSDGALGLYVSPMSQVYSCGTLPLYNGYSGWSIKHEQLFK